MARSLTPLMDAVALSADLRMPAFTLQIFDVRSGFDTIGDVVVGNDLDVVTGPRDFTGDVFELSKDENAGDFISTGIATDEVTFSIVDEGNFFDPVNLLTDPTGDGRWLREGNVIRLIEGDSRVAESEWVTTFTGVLIGQAGQDRTRSSNSALLQCKAVGREVSFLKSLDTSDSHPINSTYLFMAQDAAESEMGLDAAEIDFTGFGSTITTQKTTQFVEQPSLVSIAQLMFADGAMPKFNGLGILTSSNGLVTQGASRVYSDLKNVVSLVRPFNDEQPVNSVCIIGLNGFQTRIDSERQTLGDMTITTGYFTWSEKIPKYFSEDQTQMADNVELRVLKSVTSSLIPFLNKETISLIPPPSPAVEGSIGVVVNISTGFAPYLIIMLSVAYVAASWIPDIVLVEGFIVSGGQTIPIGRAIQALLLIQIQVIMAGIGRGEYEFIGEPFEYVFEEVRGCAETQGLTSESRVSVEIKNHLVNSQAKVDSIAREMLFRQQARGNPRDMEVMTDWRLEPDDVLELPGSGGRRFLIGSITRAYSRRSGSSGATQSMQAFEVTEGVVP